MNEPRVVCPRCRRPERVCFCRHLVSIPSRTRVVFLQHPRERNMAIGTARMASLCLPGSELHVGVGFDGTKVMQRATSDPERPAAVLWPGAGAIDVMTSPPPGPITLVVIDGTWSQAKKIVNGNPQLAALPRYAFVPPAPSEYRIRREPREDYVSTIEALVHVLGALEGDPQRFTPMLVPFRAMIDAQIEHIERLRRPRARTTPKPPRRIPPIPEVLRERWDDLVCVFGDANGWPKGSPHRSASGLADLLRWIAVRPSTGETFVATLAPRGPLAPGTAAQLELDDATLERGDDTATFARQWSAFAKPKDVLCMWGDHSLRLLADTIGPAERHAIDLRRVVSIRESRRPGAIEHHHGRLALGGAAVAPGRAGRRAGMLVAILRDLLGA
jgi:DTW domain-containing protein YfiP